MGVLPGILLLEGEEAFGGERGSKAVQGGRPFQDPRPDDSVDAGVCVFFCFLGRPGKTNRMHSSIYLFPCVFC